MANPEIFAAFVTGLVAGGLSCTAVQGGLLAAAVVQREKEKHIGSSSLTSGIFPVSSFLIAKLLVYTILGFLLGWAGSLLQLSYTLRLALQFAVVVFMFGTALNLLDIHPIFRYFIIQPPRFITRRIRSKTKSGDIFAPAMLGSLTVLIPCGTTQAIMALAVASGNALTGALLLCAFTLGTSPLFLGFGLAAAKLSQTLRQQFMKFAGIVVIIFAVFNLNSAIALSGSNWTLDNAWAKISCKIGPCNTVEASALIQSHYLAESTAPTEATIIIGQQGYSPTSFILKAGSKVTIHLNNTGNTSCAQSFTIPSLSIQKVVPLGQSGDVSFTTPTMSGSIAFMCSAGQNRGTIYLD